jgi:hypothetical protein
MSPLVLLSLLIAGVLGFVAHAALGRYLWQLPVYLIAAMIGVFAGEVAAVLAGGGLLRYGSMPVGNALIGGLGAILLAWLITFRVIARAEPVNE